MMTREMNAVDVHGPPTVPSMKPGVKLRKAIVELLETEKTYVKVRCCFVITWLFLIFYTSARLRDFELEPSISMFVVCFSLHKST